MMYKKIFGWFLVIGYIVQSVLVLFSQEVIMEPNILRLVYCILMLVCGCVSGRKFKLFDISFRRKEKEIINIETIILYGLMIWIMNIKQAFDVLFG